MPSGAASSSSSNTSNPKNDSSSGSKPSTGLIAAAVIVVVLFLAAIGGLLAYIFILRRKPAPMPGPNSTPSTELQHMQSGGSGPEIIKAELPTNEGWAVELPTSASAPGQAQSSWSNLSNSQSPASPQHTGGQTGYRNHGIAELPARWSSGPNKQYQELAG
jgi:hypothetical protein